MTAESELPLTSRSSKFMYNISLAADFFVLPPPLCALLCRQLSDFPSFEPLPTSRRQTMTFCLARAQITRACSIKVALRGKNPLGEELAALWRAESELMTSV